MKYKNFEKMLSEVQYEGESIPWRVDRSEQKEAFGTRLPFYIVRHIYERGVLDAVDYINNKSEEEHVKQKASVEDNLKSLRIWFTVGSIAMLLFLIYIMILVM